MICGHRFVLLTPPAEWTLYALPSIDLFIVIVIVVAILLLADRWSPTDPCTLE